jgi:hypothetical protein
MSIIRNPEHVISVSVEEPGYNVRLNIPKKYDVVGIECVPPMGLEKIRIFVGYSKIAEFDLDRVGELTSFPVYTSKTSSHVSLECVFSKDWLETQSCTEKIDGHVKTYGNDDVTVYDGFEYYTGKIVTKTPRTVRAVDITFPEMVFTVSPGDPEEPITVPIKEKIVFADDEHRDYLVKHHFVELIDDTKGYVMNSIRYEYGLVGLMYSFGMIHGPPCGSMSKSRIDRPFLTMSTKK